jgi:hypothetical protein
MTPRVCFWNLRAQDVLPRACLPTPSLYLAQNPPVNLVHATIPLTGARPDHVMALPMQTSLLWPGQHCPLLSTPHEGHGQTGRESPENKVLQD